VRALLGLTCFVVACYAPSPPEGAPCGPDGSCPSGQLCDPLTSTCREEGGPDADLSCPPGFVRDESGCTDIDECVAENDCSADATCRNEPGSYACTCNPGFAGDGRECTRVCASVLIYDDCTAPDADCATIPEPLFADDAAGSLGMSVSYGGVANQEAFRALFDAGGFDVVVFESSLSNIDEATATRVASWVQEGGRAIVSFWDLDNSTTGSILRTALEVQTVGEITTPQDVHHDPTSPVSFFEGVQTVPSPLVFAHLMVDDGDELAVGNGGFLAARHTSPTGAGAIAVTRGGRAITLGFLPVGLVFQGPRDADRDGRPDVQELYENLLGYLCSF
jgi:hypothetical protein